MDCCRFYTGYGSEAERETTQIRLLSRLIPGDVVGGTVCGADGNNVYVDIGGSESAVLPADRIAVYPEACRTDLFSAGQRLYAAVRRIDRAERRVYLTHKELLGTFEELSAGLNEGDALFGLKTGEHVLLSPNLAAAALNPEAARDGETVTARVAGRFPGRVEVLITGAADRGLALSFRYYITSGRIKHWNFGKSPGFTLAGESVFAYLEN